MKFIKLFFFIILNSISINSLAGYNNPVYDQSLNQTVFERLWIKFPDRTFSDKYDSLASADKSSNIVIHLHGCGGIRSNDSLITEEYNKLNLISISIDFVARQNVGFCSGGPHGNTSEASNPLRIDTRRKEAEILYNDLLSKGFSNIYISGHSEGGRVAMSWTKPVNGIIIQGMDCYFSNFWRIQKNQKTIVMLTKNDNWVTAKRPIRYCKHIFNSGYVTEIITDGSSHDPITIPAQLEALRNWFKN